MYFWIKEFYLKKSLFTKRRWVIFCYFNGYKWKRLKTLLPVSYTADMTFYTNLLINSIIENLNKDKLLEEYRKVMPFIEQLNRPMLQSATKIGR